ncbi:MAG: phage tail protein [Pseudomonadota bacterium]
MSHKSETQAPNWPLPKFYFNVKFGDVAEVAFQEVSGLDSDAHPSEYRSGSSKVFSQINIPVQQTANVQLKKGVFVSDSRCWDWLNQIKMNTVKRQSVVISLLDQEANPTMIWKLANAWPTKIVGTDLKAEGNEVAVDLIELAHEGISVETPH